MVLFTCSLPLIFFVESWNSEKNIKFDLVQMARKQYAYGNVLCMVEFGLPI